MKEGNKTVGFALRNIKNEQFALFEENYEPKGDVSLGTELEFKIDSKNKQVGVFIGFEFLQENKVFIKIVVSCHFRIHQDSWELLLYEDKTKITFPKDFLIHLAMVAIGTSRGILYAKTESTQFSKFIIPTMNVKELISEDVSFDIPSRNL